MDRRAFLQLTAAVPLVGHLGSVAWAAPAQPSRGLLILVELKGGNDGLNTVVPYADPLYRKHRPRVAIDRDAVLKLSDQAGLHPGLEKLMPVWNAKELAVVQGVGYPDPNLSHFRSIEIWDTASKSEEYLEEGWLARAFTHSPSPRAFAAEGVVVGATDMGPLAGCARTVALTSPEQFLRSARLARSGGESKNAALAHILRVENEIVASAAKLHTGYAFKTEFPKTPFGNAIKTAAQLAANPAGIAVIRVTLSGFDTHANQLGTHDNLLKNLGEGLATLRAALIEVGRWKSTLVATYSEFGRRPYQNESGGTDHGTAGVHFLMGPRVKAGVHGQAPQLDRLDGNGNLPFAIDVRAYYATLLERFWGIESAPVLRGKFRSLDLVA